jgi:hypothetical protein
MQITKLPPGQERPELRFDQHIFERDRGKALVRFAEIRDLAAATGFSFAYEDANVSHVDARTITLRTVPLWALSDRRIREVVCYRIAKLARLNPKDINFSTLVIAERRILRRFRSTNIREWNIFCESAERNGGIAALWVRIIFGAYRGGKDSVSLANETGLDPRGIRQVLLRMNAAARRLWPNEPELFVPKRTYGGRRNP